MGFVFADWKKSAIGRKIDVDHEFGDQCVDVAMDYVQAVFNKPWNAVLGYGNAKDLFSTASRAYFTKVINNRYAPNQLPPQGAIAVYDATSTNPYGHVGVVDSASPSGCMLIQQDGFNPSGACFESLRPWSKSPCIGWLIPKVSLPSKIIQKITPRPPAAQYYIVHRGDTFTAISQRFGHSVAWLAKNNGIPNPNIINQGQKLRVK